MSRRLRAMLFGALLGAALAVAGLLVARLLTPSQYTASVYMVLPDPPALQESPDELRRAQQRERDAMARRISIPDFLPNIVRQEKVSNAVAAQFSRTLRVVAMQDRPSFVALNAQSSDADALARLLDSVVEALQRADAQRALLMQDDKIQALTALDAKILEQDRAAQAQLEGVALPSWARAGATAVGLLDARKFAASLAPHLNRAVTPFEALEQTRTQREIDALMKSIGGTPAVTAKHFAAARQRASTTARRAHLARQRQLVLEEDTPRGGLQPVQYAQPQRVPPPSRRLFWIGLVGASLGALAGLLRSMAPKPRDSRDGPTLEAHVHVRVVGTIASALTDYAERKQRPLAQTHPDHLAVEGVRSLATSLAIIGASSSRHGPIIMVNADEEQNAGHVLANLAMLFLILRL